MAKKRNNRVKQITEAFIKAENIVLLSHVSPDGDTIGSMLALGLALEKWGRRSIIITPILFPGI